MTQTDHSEADARRPGVRATTTATDEIPPEPRSPVMGTLVGLVALSQVVAMFGTIIQFRLDDSDGGLVDVSLWDFLGPVGYKFLHVLLIVALGLVAVSRFRGRLIRPSLGFLLVLSAPMLWSVITVNIEEGGLRGLILINRERIGLDGDFTWIGWVWSVGLLVGLILVLVMALELWTVGSDRTTVADESQLRPELLLVWFGWFGLVTGWLRPWYQGRAVAGSDSRTWLEGGVRAGMQAPWATFIDVVFWWICPMVVLAALITLIRQTAWAERRLVWLALAVGTLAIFISPILGGEASSFVGVGGESYSIEVTPVIRTAVWAALTALAFIGAFVLATRERRLAADLAPIKRWEAQRER